MDLINFQTTPGVLHFEPAAKVKTDRRSGIEAARKLSDVQHCQHSAIQRRSELKTCWPVLKLVTRHPQNHGTVERLYGVLQDKLAIWM
ncbi:hypothetical protein T4B_9165 [Trichinella pseudospiralis]|uniref:Uncharacterized protein n=1 Tax=Trichinella pseudospiralis TaxID=6337 RepID=A0A0V1E4N6_TRIPS|nr:hypothetical protein T4A_2440 [Trichinella pseudospiralis]KRZ05763.1 hypothetical protein T4B_9165 [Trichinella pseudospiralis]